MRELTPEESLEKFFKDITNYMINKSGGDINKIPTYDDMQKLGYLEKKEYNSIYAKVKESISNKKK